jgi:hypothetical protein
VGTDVSRYDSAGDWWDADVSFGHHWYGFEGGDRYSTGNPIAGTTRDWLYQTQRRGVSSFGAWLNEGVASMQVEVEFHFAELEATGAGQRVFDIVLEQGTPNEVTIPAVDVYDQVGAGRAYTLTSTVTVQDYQVDIDFLPRAGLPPMLNGLVLRGASGTGQRVVEQYVTVLNDDTYVVGTNNYRRAETVLLGGNDGYHGGFRFFYIQIPQEATINRAFVTLTAAEESYKEMNLKIYAHDVDHSPNFQDPSLVPDRARTDHYVTWNFLGSEGWVPGRIYTSPDLSDVVQEVIDRPGWQERNALSFLFIADPGGDIPREAWAADGSFEDRAYLKIYFTQETGAPTPAPTRTPTPIPTDTPTPTRTFTPSPTNTPTPTSTPTFTPTPHAAYLPLIFQPSGKAW